MALTGVDSFKGFLENTGHPAGEYSTAVLAEYQRHLALVAGVAVNELRQFSPEAAEKAVNAGRAALKQAGLEAPLPAPVTTTMYPSKEVADLTAKLVVNRLAIAAELGVTPDDLHTMGTNGTVLDLRSQVVDTRRDLVSV